MKEHRDVVACVIDFGMIGVPMAERLARKPDGFKKVYLFCEWETDYSTVNQAIVGDGYREFQRVPDVWSILDEVDVFVCPDVQRSPLQAHLKSLGKLVWGAGAGDCLELDRELFLETLAKVGLEVPPHQVIVGVNKLRAYLKDKEDQYLKISLYRGSFETCCFRSWELDEGLLDSLAVRFGPAKELIRFLVFPNINTPLEIGGDTYFVDGQWPGLMLHGVEWKDKGYLGAVTKFVEMPKQLRSVFEKFGPELARFGYRNLFSMEVRVKGEKFYFTDATCRMGLPSTASQLEIWKNWPEIVWHGANGKMVQPVPAAKFTGEAMIKRSCDPCEEWGLYKVPKELKQWCKFMKCFEYEDKVCFPAFHDNLLGQDSGWLVAIGDSLEEVVKKLNKQADMLPDGLDANTESIAYVLKEIHIEQKQGIKFTSMEVPKPGVVFES